MGACGLYLGRREVGRLCWTEKDGRLAVNCTCPYEAGMIYRVVLQTEEGLHRLGVMLPEDQGFALRRELPAGCLPHAAFVDRTLPGEAHLPGLPLAFSAFERDEAEENLLQRSENVQILCGDWMDVRYLLFPMPPGGACCGATYFCITTPVKLEGILYGLVCKVQERYVPLSDILRGRDMIR